MQTVVAPLGLLIIVLAFLIPVLAIAAPVIIVLAIIRAVSGASRRSPTVDAQETRIMQEIHNGLGAMEKRIDNLETLLVEREREAEHAHGAGPARDGG